MLVFLIFGIFLIIINLLFKKYKHYVLFCQLDNWYEFINAFYNYLNYPLFTILTLSNFIIVSFVRLIQSIIGFFFFVQILCCTIYKLSNKKNICNPAINLPILPSWNWFLKHIFYELPKISASVTVYEIIKKFYIKTNRLPLRLIFFESFKTWFLGFPFWILKFINCLSVTIYNTWKKDEPCFITETLIFSLNTFVLINLSHNRLKYNKQRIYFENNKIIFNPQKYIKLSKSLSPTREGLCNFRIKKTNHLVLGHTENPKSPIITSHPPEGMKTLPIHGVVNSSISTNNLTNIKKLNNNLDTLSSVIEKTNMNDISYRLQLIKGIETIRLLNSDQGLHTQGYDSNITKKTGNYYKCIVNNNNNNEFKLNKKDLYKTQGLVDALENLSNEDKKQVELAGELIINDWEKNGNSPLLKSLEHSPKIFNSEKDSFLYKSESILKTHEEQTKIIELAEHLIKETNNLELTGITKNIHTIKIDAFDWSPTKSGFNGGPF